MNNSRVRNIEIPDNLFANLGITKLKKEEPKEEIPYSQQSINDKEDILLTTNTPGKYRERITKMYDDMKNIKPIDSEIDNVIYLNNYIEKGIVVKPKVSSLKQFWTEYRLINNEKKVKPLATKIEKRISDLENFDELFEALSLRISEINNYIEELKEMKLNLNTKSMEIAEDIEQLNEEKKEFQTYKKREETKIKEEKENLKINFDRLQTIIDDLDKKLESVSKE